MRKSYLPVSFKSQIMCKHPIPVFDYLSSSGVATATRLLTEDGMPGRSRELAPEA
jgi:hypothetical protein